MTHPDTHAPHVRFINVQKTYDGETLIVKNLNLDVRRGEFLTLLGPSGSGKTTSLMMLAGFETATEGDILVGGQRINRVPPHKRGMGMVFQNYALFPHMTVAENLAFPLTVRGQSGSNVDEKVKKALDMVRLTAYADRRPAQLSGGQQQRIALARALIFEPEIVLMDEPLGALDKQLREHMQIEIKHLHEKLGITMIYVTHDQSEALTMSDRIAVFNDGVIQQLAAPADLYERPENSFVAQFIGENNRLHSKVEALSAQSCDVRLTDGSVIHAFPVVKTQVGGDVSLSLRPERVDVADKAETLANYANCFSATIEEIIYLGDHLRVRVALCGHDDFIIKTQNNDLGFTPEAGQTIYVGWKLEDCRALDLLQ